MDTHEIDAKEYGRRLRYWRTKRGLHQRGLAKKLKLSKGMISSSELGKTRPQPLNRRHLADFFGIEDEWLNTPSEPQKEQETYQPEFGDSIKLKALAIAEEFPRTIEEIYRIIPKKKQTKSSDPVGTGIRGMKKRI